jgi:hypothetical protein
MLTAALEYTRSKLDIHLLWLLYSRLHALTYAFVVRLRSLVIFNEKLLQSHVQQFELFVKGMLHIGRCGIL